MLDIQAQQINSANQIIHLTVIHNGLKSMTAYNNDYMAYVHYNALQMFIMGYNAFMDLRENVTEKGSRNLTRTKRNCKIQCHYFVFPCPDAVFLYIFRTGQRIESIFRTGMVL